MLLIINFFCLGLKKFFLLQAEEAKRLCRRKRDERHLVDM